MNKLLEKIKNNDFTLGVIGIGRVGLPLALVFANSGVRVVGIDKNKEYVEKLRQGIKPFNEEGMESYMKSKNFIPTADILDGIKESDVLILTVGTPITEHMRPDYSQLQSALDEIIKADIKGKLIIMRSTVAPGTLENFVKPFLEKRTGLKLGEDFGLAMCPERILEGKAIEEVRFLPEIVGTFEEKSRVCVETLFKKINPEKKMFFTNPKSAELAKLFTNVFRYINFSLANEFGLLAEEYGEDAHEIIKILNSGYSRGGVPVPGLTGGPCLSKDGYYLLSNVVFPDFILTAWRMNEAIPNHIINRVKKSLKARGKILHNCKVSVLGIAFKANIDDTRYSPAVKIVDLLKHENADVSVHDPYIEGTDSLKESVKDADAIILAMNHSQFKDVHKVIAALKSHKPDCIFADCWGFLNPEEVRDLGFEYIRFGSGKEAHK
jgi:UDP-N-acetyl-D-mannosaminuronic acid dehydrogenase